VIKKQRLVVQVEMKWYIAKLLTSPWAVLRASDRKELSTGDFFPYSFPRLLGAVNPILVGPYSVNVLSSDLFTPQWEIEFYNRLFQNMG